MKTHSTNIIKSAIVDGRTVTAASVTLHLPIHKALAQLGARTPRFRSRHGGISIFTCADGWTYLVNVNPNYTMRTKTEVREMVSHNAPTYEN